MSLDDDLHALGFGAEGGPGTRPAVLVVDATRAFTEPDSPLACDADEAVAAIARLLEAARAGGAPVIYSSVIVDEPQRQAAVHFLRKLPGLLSIGDDPRWSEIDPRVAPAEGEPVLPKIFPSVFFETPLASLLAARRVDTLIVTGMSTSGCVRATAVDALQHGLRPLVVRDAVADRDPGAADASLRDLSLKYADVVSLSEAISYLSETADER